jgi:TolA-binding protein
VALLVVEIGQLEALAKQGSAGPDAPHLLRRLAEDYAELEAAGRNISPPVAVRSTLRPGGQDARAAAIIANHRATTDRLCRAASIRYYEALLSNHPSYAERDADSYYLAYTYERSGDLSNARRVYSDLISKFQNSHYVPLAHFGLGEIALRESAADPTKLSSARNAYQKATRWPPPANDAYGWAWVRLAQVLERQGDRKEAKTAYTAALAFARQNPIAPVSSGIAAAIPSWVQP